MADTTANPLKALLTTWDAEDLAAVADTTRLYETKAVRRTAQLREALALRERQETAEPLQIEFLESRDFYELMQAYRHSPLLPPEHVLAAFEAVKSAVRLAAHREGPATAAEKSFQANREWLRALGFVECLSGCVHRAEDHCVEGALILLTLAGREPASETPPMPERQTYEADNFENFDYYDADEMDAYLAALRVGTPEMPRTEQERRERIAVQVWKGVYGEDFAPTGEQVESMVQAIGSLMDQFSGRSAGVPPPVAAKEKA